MRRRFQGIAALVIGIITAIGAVMLTLVDSVLFDVPFPHASRLVVVSEAAAPRTGNVARIGSYDVWAGEGSIVEAVGASASLNGIRLGLGRDADVLRATQVSANLFTVLGVVPQLGRNFSADDNRGSEGLVILGDAAWRRAFGADPTVIGRLVDFGSRRARVLGILPKGARYPLTGAEPVDAYFLMADGTAAQGDRPEMASVVARLAPGVSNERARESLQARTRSNRNDGNPMVVAVRSLRDASIPRQIRAWMVALLWAVLLIVAVAYLNLAVVAYTRTMARRQEWGVRLALGATRARLVLLLTGEAIAVSAAGCSIGIAAAGGGLLLASQVLPTALPTLTAIEPGVRSLLLAIALALMGGLALCIGASLPLFTTRERSLVWSHGARMTRGRGRRAVVALSAALSTVLLVVATWFSTSYLMVTVVDTGLRVDGLVRAPVYGAMSPPTLPADRRVYVLAAQARLQEAMRALRSIPGVVGVTAVAVGPPFSGFRGRTGIAYGAQQTSRGDVDLHYITPEYFDVMAIPLLAGRPLVAADVAGSEQVVILNDEAAKRYFGADAGLGQLVGVRGQSRSVAGIVRATRWFSLEDQLHPEVYIPLAQSDQTGADVLVHTTGPTSALLRAVKETLDTAVPEMSPRLSEVVVVSQQVADMTSMRRFNALAVGLFAVLAIVVSLSSVYGLISHKVQHRRRELGVRIALGATPAAIWRLVMGGGLRDVAIGMLPGLAGAWSMSRLAQPYLFGVDARSPAFFVGAAGVVLLAGIIAAWAPTSRAVATDPVVALSAE